MEFGSDDIVFIQEKKKNIDDEEINNQSSVQYLKPEEIENAEESKPIQMNEISESSGIIEVLKNTSSTERIKFSIEKPEYKIQSDINQEDSEILLENHVKTEEEPLISSESPKKQKSDLNSESSLSFFDLPFALNAQKQIVTDHTNCYNLISPIFLPFFFRLPKISVFQGINLNHENGEMDKISIYSVKIDHLDRDSEQSVLTEEQKNNFLENRQRHFWCIDCETGLSKLELLIKSLEEQTTKEIDQDIKSLFPNVPNNLIFIHGLKKYISKTRKMEHETFLNRLKNKEAEFIESKQNTVREILIKIWMLQSTYKINLIELESTSEILNIFKNIVQFEKTVLKEKVKKRDKKPLLKFLHNLVGGRGEFVKEEFLRRIDERNTQKEKE